jgi:hypothetical protein
MRPHDPYPAVFREVRASRSGERHVHAPMLVKADEGWTDQPGSAAVSLLEEKSSLPAKTEKHVLCLMVIIDAPSHRMVE